MASEKLSNVIGAPFSEHVLTQLNLRAAHNSTGEGATPNRSNNEILFLANKMAWVKLTSSIKIQPEGNNNTPAFISEFYKKLGLNYANADDLAKYWTLEAGTSKADGANIDLRYGVGPDGAYGLGGTEELGYRPMPGLTSVTVDTKGTLGSLREATIQFKVNNMNQLNIMEALYFRLGYSMLLEWGHVQFYTNVNSQGGGGTFTTNTYGINPFEPGLRKEKVQQLIAQKSYALSGNYDGMLGIVTNFHWAFNQSGGYDCSLRLVGLGAIMDSLRINSSYTMPNAIFLEFKSEQDTLKAKQDTLDKIAADNAEKTKRANAGFKDPLPATPTNPQEIYTNIYTTDMGVSPPPLNQNTFLANKALPVAYNVDTPNQVTNTVYDYYYKAEHGGKTGQAFIDELNQKRTGLFLNTIPNLRSTWTLLPAANYPAVILSKGLLEDTAIRTSQQVQTFAFEDMYGPTMFGKNFTYSYLLGNSTFVKAFDFYVYNYPGTGEASRTNYGTFHFEPNDPIYANYKYIFGAGSVTKPLKLGLKQDAYVINPATKVKELKSFIFLITYTPLANPDKDQKAQDLLTRPTRKELVTALESWFLNDRKVQITSIDNVADAELATKEKIAVQFANIPQNSVLVSGTFTVTIPKKPLVTLTIQFTNTALIQTALPSPLPTGVDQNALQNANAGADGGADNKATDQQTDPGFKFASALHAMLAAVKSKVEYDMATNQKDVVIVPLKDTTQKFYEGTILEKLFNTTVNTSITDFDLIQYALKGFNSNLMANAKNDPALFNNIKTVDFESLCTAYGIRWSIQDDTNQTNHPAYIKLGYLMSFLNAMCLIYDSTQDNNKHPYVYLDFNPYTNFCLTMPQHMSIDPFTCMIPFQGTQADYLKIFPPEVTPDSDPTGTALFGEKANEVSYYLPKFKAGNNPYQGSTMEILLNIDFLISTLNARTTSSPDHTVDLKGFLDDIMTGINKSTGNLNSFRVSYRDDSNTVIIKDDQFVPPMENEKWDMGVKANPSNYGVPNGLNVPKYGQLPVFGKYSLVRDMSLETNMTTNISKVIAISGQSDTNSVNSTDHSSFSWLNTNFQDRYKPRVSDSSNTNSKTNNNKTTEQEKKTQEKAANDAAAQFNQHVLSIYRGGVALSQKTVSAAANYYINGIAQVKSVNKITQAAPFIPANLNLTIDGIGGIIMGNAFTIPEDRLPLSLRGQGGTDKNTKVGFIVVGLTHTFDNNQWLTKIRGQMIKLRDSTDYGIATTLKELQLTFPTTQPVASVSTGTVINPGSLNLNQDWIGIAFDFISKQEGFLSRPQWDYNHYRAGYGSDNIVTVDSSGKTTVSEVTTATVFTRADAERTLKYNIAGIYKNGVVHQIGQSKWDSLNDKQKATLISYSYNAGAGALKIWGIKKAIEIGAPKEQVAQAIARGPVTAGGKRLDGLVRRRNQEAQLYLS
jgi:GH24 family phage-related lysozyme (muramidase)